RASRLKPILVHPGIGELLALHRADSIASARPTEHVEFCERGLRETPADELNPPPTLTGDDLLALGWERGPLFKKVLDAVREAQLEGKVRTKEEAIRLAAESRLKGVTDPRPQALLGTAGGPSSAGRAGTRPGLHPG